MRFVALTQTPIERGDGFTYEFVMDPSAVDLSRVPKKAVHVDLHHDRDKIVGRVIEGLVVLNRHLELEAELWRDTPEAKAYAERYEDGRMSKVSVEIAANRRDVVTTGKGKKRVNKWALLGMALTGHPADEDTTANLALSDVNSAGMVFFHASIATPKQSPRPRPAQPTRHDLSLADMSAEWRKQSSKSILPQRTCLRIGDELVKAMLATSDPGTEMLLRSGGDNFWLHRDPLPHPGRVHLRLDDLMVLQQAAIELSTKYGGTAGTDSVGATAVTGGPVFIRADVPDPISGRLLPLLTRLPSDPGEGLQSVLSTPDADTVPEPGDDGYTKTTGDSHTTAVKLTPHIIDVSLRVSRVAEASQMGLLTAIGVVSIAKLFEALDAQILAGSGQGDDLLGLYADAGISSTAVFVVADWTAAAVRTALDGPTKGRNPRLIAPYGVQTSLREIASPSGAGKLVEPDGPIDGVGMLRTDYLAAGGTKPLRGLVVALGEGLFKIWGDRVEATAWYLDGAYDISLSLFADAVLPIKSYGHRFLQA